MSDTTRLLLRQVHAALPQWPDRTDLVFVALPDHYRRALGYIGYVEPMVARTFDAVRGRVLMARASRRCRRCRQADTASSSNGSGSISVAARRPASALRLGRPVFERAGGESALRTCRGSCRPPRIDRSVDRLPW
ncbi:MAG: hypothetical protein WDO24_19115 [Pseudomonadota bacterium]